MTSAEYPEQYKDYPGGLTIEFMDGATYAYTFGSGMTTWHYSTEPSDDDLLTPMTMLTVHIDNRRRIDFPMDKVRAVHLTYPPMPSRVAEPTQEVE